MSGIARGWLGRLTLAEKVGSSSALETDYRSVVITPSRAFADRTCACQDRMDVLDEIGRAHV